MLAIFQGDKCHYLLPDTAVVSFPLVTLPDREFIIGDLTEPVIHSVTAPDGATANEISLQNGAAVYTPVVHVSDPLIVASYIAQLWQAANDYTQSYISGVAIGLLTIGVIQQKPKALAVTAWSGRIWAEYYARKAAVTDLEPPNLDFRSFGPMPYSVPELQAELGM